MKRKGDKTKDAEEKEEAGHLTIKEENWLLTIKEENWLWRRRIDYAGGELTMKEENWLWRRRIDYKRGELTMKEENWSRRRRIDHEGGELTMKEKNWLWRRRIDHEGRELIMKVDNWLWRRIDYEGELIMKESNLWRRIDYEGELIMNVFYNSYLQNSYLWEYCVIEGRLIFILEIDKVIVTQNTLLEAYEQGIIHNSICHMSTEQCSWTNWCPAFSMKVELQKTEVYNKKVHDRNWSNRC